MATLNPACCRAAHIRDMLDGLRTKPCRTMTCSAAFIGSHQLITGANSQSFGKRMVGPRNLASYLPNPAAGVHRQSTALGRMPLFVHFVANREDFFGLIRLRKHISQPIGIVPYEFFEPLVAKFSAVWDWLPLGMLIAPP